MARAPLDPPSPYAAACRTLKELAAALLSCDPVTLRPRRFDAPAATEAWCAAVQLWQQQWQPVAQRRLEGAVEAASAAHAAWMAQAAPCDAALQAELPALHALRLARCLREASSELRAACPLHGLEPLRHPPYPACSPMSRAVAETALPADIDAALERSARAGAQALLWGQVDAALATLCQDLLLFCGQALHRLETGLVATPARRARAASLLVACVSAHLRPDLQPVAAELGQGHGYRCRDLIDSLGLAPRRPWTSVLRMMGWALICAATGRRREALAKEPDTPARRTSVWLLWQHWAALSARWLGLDVRMQLSPGTAERWARLRGVHDKPRLLLLPTHQGLLDHVAMYCAAAHPLMRATLERPAELAWTIVARSGLAMAGPTLLGRTVFGGTAGQWDQSLLALDGYLLPGHQSPRVLRRAVHEALDRGPVLLYPMGTTAAYEGQVLPSPSGVLSPVTPDVVVVPIALRGTHRAWPKSPRGNWSVRPGRVDVLLLPPLAAGGLLLPQCPGGMRQDALAALVQALHGHALAAVAAAEPSCSLDWKATP